MGPISVDWLFSGVSLKGAVIGAIIGILLREFWYLTRNNFWPRFQNWMQKGPDVSGSWTSSFQEDGEDYEEELNIKQVGDKIEGDITLKQEDGSKLEYKFKGSIKERVILGFFESKSRTGFEQGTFFLQLRPEGNHADGKYVLFSKAANGGAVPTAVDYQWTRAGKSK